MMEFFEQQRPHRGMDFKEYVAHQEAYARRAAAGELEAAEADHGRYAQLNLQRSRRITKTYEVPESLAQRLAAVTTPQLWMVLTEPWCGDSAQALPYAAKLADACPGVELRILLRDQNLDIMDHYLTGGKRGIPVLVAFSPTGEELFRWGPRPEGAGRVFAAGRAAGHEKETIVEDLHRWYAQNRGAEIIQELVARIPGIPAADGAADTR